MEGQAPTGKLDEGTRGCRILPGSCSSQRDPAPAGPQTCSFSTIPVVRAPAPLLPPTVLDWSAGTVHGKGVLLPYCCSSPASPVGREREVPPRCSNPVVDGCFPSWEMPGSLQRRIMLGGRRRRRGEWVCKHLPWSSLEQALPLFELEVGT